MFVRPYAAPASEIEHDLALGCAALRDELARSVRRSVDRYRALGPSVGARKLGEVARDQAHAFRAVGRVAQQLPQLAVGLLFRGIPQWQRARAFFAQAQRFERVGE